MGLCVMAQVLPLIIMCFIICMVGQPLIVHWLMSLGDALTIVATVLLWGCEMPGDGNALGFCPGVFSNILSCLAYNSDVSYCMR